MLVEGCMYVVLLIQCVCIWIVAWVCVWANAGLFYQRVMNCTSCQYGLFTCLSATPPIDCGGETNTHIFTQQNNFSNSSLYKHISSIRTSCWGRWRSGGGVGLFSALAHTGCWTDWVLLLLAPCKECTCAHRHKPISVITGFSKKHKFGHSKFQRDNNDLRKLKKCICLCKWTLHI